MSRRLMRGGSGGTLAACASNTTTVSYCARSGGRAGRRTWVNYARALYKDAGATLNDLREAVTTVEDAARTARRVLGGSHPLTAGIETSLREARAALRARETPSTSA